MSKSFSDFCEENSSSQTPDIEKTYDELKDMDYDELTKRLYSEVKAQKDNGTFNFESLKASVESIKPFISAETYENMQNMLNKIK